MDVLKGADIMPLLSSTCGGATPEGDTVQWCTLCSNEDSKSTVAPGALWFPLRPGLWRKRCHTSQRLSVSTCPSMCPRLFFAQSFIFRQSSHWKHWGAICGRDTSQLALQYRVQRRVETHPWQSTRVKATSKSSSFAWRCTCLLSTHWNWHMFKYANVCMQVPNNTKYTIYSYIYIMYCS